MKNSVLEFAKELGVKGWFSILFLLVALGLSIWLAMVGSIDLLRDLSSERSVGLSFVLAMAGTMIAASVIVDRSSYQSNRGRLLTVLIGTLVSLLGVAMGIRLNSLSRTLMGGAYGLAVSLVLLIPPLVRKVRK